MAKEVIVYDLKSKLSSKGKITEVLGNNTYLADCDKGLQHISGDVISRISGVAKRQVGDQIFEVYRVCIAWNSSDTGMHWFMLIWDVGPSKSKEWIETTCDNI